MFPSVTLAPWELPPDCSVPLTAPADFVFRCQWGFGCRKKQLPETELWFRTMPCNGAFIHYFCDGAMPGNGNWILSDRGTHLPISKAELDGDLLGHLFRSDNDHWFDHIMRVVYFDGTPYGFPGSHRVTVGPDTYCWITSGNPMYFEPDGRRAQFHLPTRRYRTPTRSTTMKNMLFAALNDEGSEARFALNWMQLFYSQQQERLFHFQRGSLLAMQVLLRAVLQSQVGIWQQNQTLFWRTYDESKSPFHHVKGGLGFVPYPSVSGIDEIDVPPRLARWKDTIWSYFMPERDEELFRFAYIARNGNGLIGTIAVEVAPPPSTNVSKPSCSCTTGGGINSPPCCSRARNSNNEFWH